MAEAPKTDGAAKKSSTHDELHVLEKPELSKTGGNSTTRSKGAAEPKAERVYLRVPITEVIIKTSLLPERNRSRSRKNDEGPGHGSGDSTV